MNAASLPILVGYDGSSESEAALSWAEDIAVRSRRPLHLLISEVPPPQVVEITSDRHAAHMAEVEASARSHIKQMKALTGSVDVVRSPPAHALIDASANASLVVVGARGHSLLSGVMLGSVSQHVARHAACSVVVVRTPRSVENRIVVGVDGSSSTPAVVKFAVEQAELTGASLTVIHAWGSPLFGAGPAWQAARNDPFGEGRDIAERIVSEAVAGLEETHPDVRIQTEVIPVPASRCLADASAIASLLVVGSRGRGAFAGMLLGSTSQGVLHLAQCPVAIVR